MNDVRWIQRCDNFGRALNLLTEFLERAQEDEAFAKEPIVREGGVQRFIFTFELAWKTLKDKMEHDGLTVDIVSPKFVFRLAYQSKYIKNIDLWLKMVNDRNTMSHTYSSTDINHILESVRRDYHPLLQELYTYFLEEQL